MIEQTSLIESLSFDAPPSLSSNPSSPKHLSGAPPSFASPPPSLNRKNEDQGPLEPAYQIGPSTAQILWSQKPQPSPASDLPQRSPISAPPSLTPQSADHEQPPPEPILAHLYTEVHASPSRTLAPERLAQLYDTPQVFLFGGNQSLTQEMVSQPKIWQRSQDLLRFCEPLLTEHVNEASIFLAFELPPRSWLQALHDLRPDGEVLVWLPSWPEGKTGTQLHEGRTSAFFYGEEGLIELAVTLYRLAPFSLEKQSLDPWWSQVKLRACLIEVEHFQRLLAQPTIDTYLVTLFAQRMRRWARVGKDPLWAKIAQASHRLSNDLSQGQSGGGGWSHSSNNGSNINEVLTLSEQLLRHELLSRPRANTAIRAACLTHLRDDHPELSELLEGLNVEISWFKHPQALLNSVNETYFQWCFLSEYAGAWDGFDLAQEVRSRAQHIKICVSVLSRRTHILARAEHLKVEVLLYPTDAMSMQVIALSRALHDAQSTNGEREGLLQRLQAIESAQSGQSLPQRTGILLIRTEAPQPWLPVWLSEIEELRKEHMPKSLSALSLDEYTIAFPIANDEDEPVRSLCTAIQRDVYGSIHAGCILNQGPRNPDSALADVLLRLDWTLVNRELISLGWWKSGLEYEESLGAHGAQMLIVDNDPTSVDLLRFFCERAGLMVTVLNSGQSAVELLDKLQYPPQLIVAECMLPYVNGFQVLEACQKLTTGRPKVILSSSIKRDELIERAFNMGACDFVYKPFNMAEVMARVLHALV